MGKRSDIPKYLLVVLWSAMAIKYLAAGIHSVTVYSDYKDYISSSSKFGAYGYSGMNGAYPPYGANNMNGAYPPYDANNMNGAYPPYGANNMNGAYPPYNANNMNNPYPSYNMPPAGGKICSSCGSPVIPGSQFCAKCGNKM